MSGPANSNKNLKRDAEREQQPWGPALQQQPKQEQRPESGGQWEEVKKKKVKKYPSKKEREEAERKCSQLPPSEGPSQQQPPVQIKTEEIEKNFESMGVSPKKKIKMIEASPDGRVYEGKRGTPCRLEVNYLEILINNLKPNAFHYDVTFTPDVPKKMLPKALEAFMKNNFPKISYSFDGRKSFYTVNVMSKDLEETFEHDVIAILGDRQKDFKVNVKLATIIDMSVLKHYRKAEYQNNDKPMQAVQCLDVILRTAFNPLISSNRAIQAGRALYFAQERSIPLGDSMELWLGLFQSAVLGRDALYLNVDVAHKAFPSPMSLLDLVRSFDRSGNLPARFDDRYGRQLTEHLKMLSVSYRPDKNQPAKTFGFNGLKESANNATFVDEKGVKMTVQGYFQKKGIRLQFPDYPVLWVGSRARNVYLPMELCEIPAGQATNKKCTPKAVAAMIKYSATSTDERKRKILDLLKKINYQNPQGEISGFGVEIGKNFIQTDGRIIEAPQIKYLNQTVRPDKGVWRGEKFLESAKPVKWAVINCDERTSIQEVVTFKKNILSESRRMGMNLAESRGDSDYIKIKMASRRFDDDLNSMVKGLEWCKVNGYGIVFVIIVDFNDCYAKVKQAAELKVGILTQCLKANTIFRMGKGNPMMTINNILLKVNAKLNGKNHEVIERSYNSFNQVNNGVMFIGADVTHPSPDQSDIPSVVGVAASYDDVGFRYQCAWRLQQPKEEMIVDLENILVEQLHFYKKQNKKLPTKIMYYRDGVSEGQFTEVLEIEMKAIRAAMLRIYGPQQPQAKVTFIVVQKRHHTRFFPTQRKFSDGRNNNIPAGTVVDKSIVHPFQYQFFLASHAAIQGVTKPTKYCILVNESKILPDDLQAITYDLCHLFTRCNRSVSYPAPTYYAHLVAARGKQYTIGRKLDMSLLKQEYQKRTVQPFITVECPMYFV
ncbi:CLUMA_CG019029, isoform A [Clunio marinus]|uniref:CLUMA_CG019029, isoform A n=1 Tax=Clunio marinus TaxID=568069 RepID=A0A1J1J0G6_9DIPT|nr:CLUMA_CG019029, isoform A [Clunio marinus]